MSMVLYLRLLRSGYRAPIACRVGTSDSFGVVFKCRKNSKLLVFAGFGQMESHARERV